MSEENRNKPYKTKSWKVVRASVMKQDKYLCQRCLGNYMPDEHAVKKRTKAVLVHHHFHVTDYPQYKYQKYVVLPNGEKVRNLYSLCFECHEAVHPEHRKNSQIKKESEDSFTTIERWD